LGGVEVALGVRGPALERVGLIDRGAVAVDEPGWAGVAEAVVVTAPDVPVGEPLSEGTVEAWLHADRARASR
jgi:hypothetical protein